MLESRKYLQVQSSLLRRFDSSANRGRGSRRCWRGRGRYRWRRWWWCTAGSSSARLGGRISVWIKKFFSQWFTIFFPTFKTFSYTFSTYLFLAIFKHMLGNRTVERKMFVITVICYNREQVKFYLVIWDQKWDNILFVIAMIRYNREQVMFYLVIWDQKWDDILFIINVNLL